MQQDSSSQLASWLDNLQQESYRLELLVSGFSIVLLIGLRVPLQEFEQEITRLTTYHPMWDLLRFPHLIMLGAWLSLLINLIIHVILRGLWISTVGLRSVSGDIDYEQLQLQPRFEQFLRRRSGSFDRYIERLEEICSIIFAFTFLLVFVIVSSGVFFLFMTGLSILLSSVLLPFGKIVGTAIGLLNLTILLFAIIYFIDFVSMGWIKRRRWATGWYFIVYRIMGVLTLAFLYRPLYYNLIDNKLGRRAGLLVIPYLVVSMLLGSTNYITDTYFPSHEGEQLLQSVVYDQLRPADAFTTLPSIPDKYPSHGYLEVFIPYVARQHDPVIETRCPELVPAQFTGIRIQGAVTFHGIKNGDSDNAALLTCLSQLFEVRIDERTIADPGFHFYEHPTRSLPGLLAVIDVDSLARGEHQLHIRTRVMSTSDSLTWKETALIPFWQE